MGEYDDEREDLETEFPTIVFNNTSDTTPPCEPTISPPNKNQIDFRISLYKSDDEDYTVIFDENSFSYNIIYVNDLKMDLEDGNGNMSTSPKPTVDYFDDLDYFKDFENEFPADVYNDGLTSKSDLRTKPLVISECIKEFNLIDETSLSEYDEEIVSRFNNLFNDIHHDDLKSEKDDEDDDISIIQSLKDNEISHGENELGLRYSNIVKEIRASTDASIRNQGASIKTLELQIGQMSKVLQEIGFGSLPGSTKTNPRDQVKSSSTATADLSEIRRMEHGPYAVSGSQHRFMFPETVSFPRRLHNYCCDGLKEAHGANILDAYNGILPQKEKDPGSFTVPCLINNICFDKALVDLGASVSVMPFSTYTNLGLGDLSHTRMTIELADRTIKQPKGITANVLVRVGKFVFPIDFVILDIPEDNDVPLILGRPFLSTAHVKIDVYKRKVYIRLIMESLVKKKQKGAILELKRRHLKNTIFCTYTPYPAMKIRRISASSAQETRNDQFPIRRKRFCLLCVGMNLCEYGTKSLGLGIAFLSMTIFCGLDRGTRSVLMVIVGCMNASIYACSDSLLLTPLCYDDIHDVTPRVSALAGCDMTARSRCLELIQKYPQQVDYKEMIEESVQANIINEIDKIRSYLTHDKHQALYDALLNSMILDDAIARSQANLEKVLRKRDRDDEDPSSGLNQCKKTKRSRTKESEPSKKSSTSKESSKCKSPAKTSKSGKSVTAEEPVEELIFEMASDDIEQTVDDVANDVNQPPNDSTQTKDKDPKKYWFKQPPRPPTPHQEWNKHQVVDDQPKQPWFKNMVSAAKDPLTFDEQMATSIDF
ncbi:retrovirus-related pol polyprotein from transposon TNT 1-94 [Tanacetum coccineum]